jgi:hypothetical protein
MLSEGLNYYKKLDAMGIRNNKERVNIQPTNGSSFTTDTGKIRLVIPCNQKGKFADLKNMYMMAKYTNGDGNSVRFQGSLGTQGIVKKIRYATDSDTVFSELDNQNVLSGMKIEENVDSTWLDNKTKIFGTASDAAASTAVAAGGNITLALPFLNSGITESTYFPLGGRENIVMELSLESAITCFFGTAATLAANDVTVSEINCYYDVYKLDSDEYNKLLEQFDNTLRISHSDWAHTSDIIPNTDTSRVINLGFAYEKVKKMYVCLRTEGKLTTANATSLQSRNKAKMSKITVLHNGSVVGSRAVNVTTSTSESAEVYAELLKCHGGLWNLHSTHLTDTYSSDEPDASDNANTGKFFFVACFENGFENSESISGLDVRQGSFQLQIEKAASTANQRVDVFVEYHSEYVLDMNESGGVWVVNK